jgi:hypothetical protein
MECLKNSKNLLLIISILLMAGCALFKTAHEIENERIRETWEGRQVSELLDRYGLFEGHFEGDDGSTIFAYRFYKPEGFCILFFRADKSGTIVEASLRRKPKKNKYGLDCLE